MKIERRHIWTAIAVCVFIVVLLMSIEQSRTFLIALFLRLFLFVKQHIVALLAAFFLVKGKFILSLFLKKIALLSVTGLSKRYLIEKVINYNLKIHFLDHIADDIKRLVVYVKENFKRFPIVKQIVAVVAFVSSLGFVGKFMGGMLAMKVFIAKFWSFLLGLVLKFSTAVVYFFTDYLWGSWIAPLVEVLIFSWLLELLERVPFLKRYIQAIYRFFLEIFRWFEQYAEKLFHIPLKRFFRFLRRFTREKIYRLIGYQRVSAWKRLQELRILQPNRHEQLMLKRQEREERRSNARGISRYYHYKQKKRQRGKL